MTNKDLNKGPSKRPLKFLAMFFSLILIVSGFVIFIDSTSAAKFNNTSNNTLRNSSKPSSFTSQKDNIFSDDGLWQKVDKNAVKNLTTTTSANLSKSNLIQLNKDALTAILSGAPLETSKNASTDYQIMTLPMPDGSFARFRIVESPIMESGLAAAFPDIKTYSGRGIDDPSAYVRFDTTTFGFHAMIQSPNGLVLIDPYASDNKIDPNTDFYVSYLRKDISGIKRNTTCLFKGEDIDISDFKDDNSRKAITHQDLPDFNLSSGPTLRTYRLAVSTTGEFAQFYGGTVSGAMNGMVTIVNRVNGVYEMELGVRMVLVNNNSSLIFTNPATDPFTNSDGVTLLGQNQTTVDNIIGNANYDIGHIFSTGGGGIAGLGVICATGQKARGVTGLPSPIGDAFAIDFVAHEMGHQFGGNHTFNGTTSNCGGGNRSSANAYEPGSGSTIMAYAGICGSENLQSNSDPYFHGRSFDEIINRITSTNCAVQSSTGNSTPTVDAGPNFTIPQSTPFTLTAASASDPDNDPLTYCWEEFDLGASGPPNTDDGSRPIFRSFNPTTSPSRTFPKLSDILNNTSSFGESLPITNRTMNFRLTVRDNRAGGGGVNNDTMQVTVTTAAGPFIVTQPNTGGTFTGGGPLTVTWNVANTNLSPVNAANVKISLSTDGGNTFPTVLASSTPNDGSQSVTLPNTQTSTARIKVEAVGNIFFDVSNANFTIQPNNNPNCTFTISPTSTSVAAAGATGSITVTASDPSCTRTATSNDPFITVTSGATGTGNGTVGYSVAANTSTSSRTGTITVAGQTFTVNQAGASVPTCSFTLSPSVANVGLTAGTGSITVTASDSSCARTAVSNSSFITITSGATGTGSGTVTYSYTFSKLSRTGTITVGGQTFTLNQSLNPGSCNFTISPTSTSVAAAGATGSITVTAADQSCSRTATSNSSFITVTSGATGTGSGTVGYSVAANTLTSPRTGTITVAGQTFTVNQDAASTVNCNFTISPTSTSVAAAGATGSITVTASDPSCARTATSNDAFITVTSGATGTGNGIVGYSVAANTSTSSRTGTITVAGQTFTVNQAGATAGGCSFTISPSSANVSVTAGTGSITITASDPSCPRTAVSNSSFITITSGATGTGSGTVTYSYTFSKVPRTGTITVAGQIFTLNQSFAGRTKNRNKNR